MTENLRVIAHGGLRLRSSPRDGATLAVLPEATQLKLLGRETWLRVEHAGQVGFVLEDFVEAMPASGSADSNNVADKIADKVAEVLDYVPTTSSIRGAPLRIDRDFAEAMRSIERLAETIGVVVWITSSLREPYKPVANAIVAPAKYSNHHVGHGFDMNLVVGGVFLRSSDLGAFNSLPAAAQAFLTRVQKELGLRWGGTFSTPDPVHIDDGLNLRQPDIFFAKLKALWGIEKA